MYLTVVATHLLLEVDYTVRLCQWVSTDASCVNVVFFWQAVYDTGVLCDIPVGHVPAYAKRQICVLQFVEKCPAHDAHKCGIRKLHATVDGLWKLYSPFVITLVAGFAQSNEVVWSVTAGLTALDMVHVENLVVGFALTALAFMSIAEEYILPDIPEVHLVAVLIVRARNIRVLNLLNVKCCRLHRDVRNRNQLEDLITPADEKTHGFNRVDDSPQIF